METPKGVYVRIQGVDIYHTALMPEVPRKGDILWMSSLTRGAIPINEVQVSRVEWSMDQQSGIIGAWLIVRRTSKSKSTSTASMGSGSAERDERLPR